MGVKSFRYGCFLFSCGSYPFKTFSLWNRQGVLSWERALFQISQFLDIKNKSCNPTCWKLRRGLGRNCSQASLAWCLATKFSLSKQQTWRPWLQDIDILEIVKKPQEANNKIYLFEMKVKCQKYMASSGLVKLLFWEALEWRLFNKLDVWKIFNGMATWSVRKQDVIMETHWRVCTWKWKTRDKRSSGRRFSGRDLRFTKWGQ